MARHSAPEPAGRHRVGGWLDDRVAVAGDPAPEEMVSTTEAARILQVSSRTVIRRVDSGTLRGDRARNPHTGEPLPWAPRWVDARHAVALAVASGRGHLVPEEWQYLVRRNATGPVKEG